jgi:hypothetical protein
MSKVFVDRAFQNSSPITLIVRVDVVDLSLFFWVYEKKVFFSFVLFPAILLNK